ncbi:hypothetical protein BGW42_007161 [Actinomortierella wolfii]|nr:hypothetical protein BGW42_007161 [Actinomortierella wolfii]
MAEVESSQKSTTVHDIPDYNTIYNAPGGASYDYSQNIHPFAQSPTTGVRFDSVSPSDTSKPAANVPTVTTTTTAAGTGGVALLPSQPGSTTEVSQQQSQQQQQQSPQGFDRRRSSIGVMLSSMFSGRRSSSSANSSDIDLQRTRSVPVSTYSTSSRSHRKSQDLGRRRSSAFLSTDDIKEGNVHKGPYAHVSKAQAEHMERLREAERNLGRTTNIDGLPLPEAQADEKRHRRRSSLANILGLNKKILAF